MLIVWTGVLKIKAVGWITDSFTLLAMKFVSVEKELTMDGICVRVLPDKFRVTSVFFDDGRTHLERIKFTALSSVLQ